MRFLKNIRLSVQLFALVAVTLAIASALIAYSMQQVRSTQGTLKHTIDNRMVSGQSIQGVADALSLSLEASLDVIEKKQSALDAHDQIKKAIDKARDDWDNYFLGDMIARTARSTSCSRNSRPTTWRISPPGVTRRCAPRSPMAPPTSRS